MKKNMGSIDKIVRLIIAAIIVFLYYGNIISGTLAIILLAASAIFVLTSVISFCPLYTLFGCNTCKVKDDKK